MARYIDADKAKEVFYHKTGGCMFDSFIDDTPTADVVEVMHGEWIYKNRHRGGFERKIVYDDFGNPHTVTIDNRYECDEPYCSVCGKLGGDFLNYCGNCGAKMDGERKDT